MHFRPRLRGRRTSQGQSLVEFALVLPVFVLLLAGMIDFGLGLYSYMSLQSAAREGARLGVTDCTRDDCATTVSSRVTASSAGLAPTVTVTCTSAAGATIACSSTVPGDSVTVTASYTYRMVWPLTFGTSIPMASSVRMMLE